MLGKISRLFGGQQQQHTGNRERECSSKRQDGDGWDASSSKKVRVEAVKMVCKPGGDGNDQTVDQEVVVIKEELTKDADDNSEKFETLEEGKKEVGHDPNQTFLEKEKELTSAHADLNFLQSSASAPILCCVCKQLPRSLPISSCNSHHKICNSCSSKLSDCPTCSKPLYKESSPLLKALFSSLSRPCTWSSTGCSFQSCLEELEKHEETCKYQAVFCWGCQSNTPLCLFDQHDPNLACFSYHKVHESPVKKTFLHAIPKFNGKFPLQYSGDFEWDPLAIKHSGKMFYLRIKRIASRGVWVLYTAAQLLPSQSSQYLTTITLSCPDSERVGTSWTYTGPPSSLVMGLDKVLREGRCLVMTDPAMEQLMARDRENRGTLFTVRVVFVNNKLGD